SGRPATLNCHPLSDPKTLGWLTAMSFSQRILELRKKLGMTQQGFSAATEFHVQQIKRYEAGSSLRTADALKSWLSHCM
ncbi:helix-turn-helix domain-containing protein, partial [Pseudomonas viridiflava]|uniref:helix-turn-helix domain-containing protein n=1 Tax=Pseudomonas viridiflava TaxID=33069 RepID=UPI00197EB8B2